MNILLTNDDGWDAPGLAALRKIASQWGKVWVVAPLHPMSGISHQITFERPMALSETGPHAYSLDGTPADCIRIATTQLPVEFDWVISGINNGGNLGSDIYVSGTVAAAREATLRGIRAIALSQHRSRFKLPFDWTLTRWMGEAVLERLLATGSEWEAYSLINVNFPDKYHHPQSPARLDAATLAQHSNAAVESPLTAATSLDDPPEIDKVEFLRELSLVECPVDRQPIPADFRREEDGRLLYCSRYNERSRTSGCDIETCFGGSITLSTLRLS